MGSDSVWSVRGRTRRGGLTGTVYGLYQASFDSGSDYIIGTNGSNYQWAEIDSGSVSWPFADLALAGSATPPSGVHFGNRHYLSNGAVNLVVGEGLFTRSPGMVGTTATISATTSSSSGSWSATIGCEYWVTEYDSVRGIESAMRGTTGHSGPATDVASVSLLITGVSANRLTDYWRIYRSTDGGVFPDGGLLAEIPVGITTFTDTDVQTDAALVPFYGNINIGGLDYDRDSPPPVLSSLASFDGSLIGIPEGNRHVLRFTPANYPESWPEIYEIPLQTERHDLGVGFAGINGQLGVFTKDTVYRLTRLPREVDAVYSPSEILSLVTSERGAVSRRGIATMSLPGRGPLIAFVARDGIWATNLAPNIQIPLTDSMDWLGRVDTESLDSAVLANDPLNRRLVFIYRGVGQSYSRSVTYLDYQGESVRITHPNHGPLTDAVLGPIDGVLRLITADSRAGNGSVYTEGDKDTDDSELIDSSGSISGAIRTAEMFPAGVHGTRKLGVASWMHGAGPSRATHEFYQDRIESPALQYPNLASRDCADIALERVVNSFSLRLSWTTTVPFQLAWLDVEGLESAPLHGPGA